ncbi:tetratricopeptide repeat protein [Psychrobacillus soli]|uniref:Tetratricopeptide repeat protein n=1 Tax=Psychrobacillus soli TaxID=1543965 RepID=A0A544SLM6_9BACI|nr:tetratricopeptide repeat protein [Psychrobacillus soli]TQR06116.1 tetratricopeptide repeat protein [Psychrobacillus soli]
MNKKSKKVFKENIISFLPTGEYYYKKALDELQKEKYEKAHKYLKRAVDLSPDDPAILMQYAILQMELDKFDVAHELLRSAYTIDPDDPEIVFFLAEVNAHIGNFMDANRFAKRYLELSINGEYAEDAMEIVDFTEQEDVISLQMDAPSSEALFLQEKSRRLMEQGKFPEAVELLEDIITEYPDFWAAFNNLALAYFYIGEEEQAKALLHEVLRENRGNIHALCNLAVIYYYEKNAEDLEEITEFLSKINPYFIEHRYKLGATFALIGKYEQAFKWLRSLQRKGFEGDPGFYFWLSHSAYFSGHEEVAKNAWKTLLKLDPEKAGFEPWLPHLKDTDESMMENQKEFILEKLHHKHVSERILGFYLIGKSAHRQEIISHPKWIVVEELTTMEKLFLAHSLGHSFSEKSVAEKAFLRAIAATDLLYEKHKPLEQSATFLFQMWFVLVERALKKAYAFKNPRALAAATEYMFESSRKKNVTKKQYAEEYGITTTTLTKYVNELMQFLPLFDA